MTSRAAFLHCAQVWQMSRDIWNEPQDDDGASVASSYDSEELDEMAGEIGNAAS
jgi:hypothetical protein